MPTAPSCPSSPNYPTPRTAGDGVGQLWAVSIRPYHQGVGWTLGRGHMSQIRPKMPNRLLLKCILPKDFRTSLVSLVGWSKWKLTNFTQSNESLLRVKNVKSCPIVYFYSSKEAKNISLNIFQYCKKSLLTLRNITTWHQSPQLICSIHKG